MSNFTIDRYGNGYVGGGPAVGVGANSLGGSVMGTWLLQDSAPTRTTCRDYHRLERWHSGRSRHRRGIRLLPLGAKHRHGIELGSRLPASPPAEAMLVHR